MKKFFGIFAASLSFLSLVASPVLASGSSDAEDGAALLVIMCMSLVGCSIIIAAYIFISWNISTIGQKNNYTENSILAWIPFAQYYYLGKAIGEEDNIAYAYALVPLTALIPIVNYCTGIFIYGLMGVMWMRAGKAMNKGEFYGLLTLIPLVNIYIVYDIAQNGTPVAKAVATEPAK